MADNIAPTRAFCWDGNPPGTVISGPNKFGISEKLEIPGVIYDTIYYEPGYGNAFKVVNGETTQLTEEELTILGKFCDTFVDSHDFDVCAYANDLYVSVMTKSKAVEQKLDYTLIAPPDHPASKLVKAADGTVHWEKIKLVVRVDGTYVLDPENLCSQCIHGYTATEWEELPKPVTPYDRWDFVTSTWKDSRTLEQCQTSAISELHSNFDILIAKALGPFIPSYQMRTWEIQVTEAIWFIGVYCKQTNPSITTLDGLHDQMHYLTTFLKNRQNYDPTKWKDQLKALCDDVLANHIKYVETAATISAKIWDYKDEIRLCTKNSEVDAVTTAISKYITEQLNK